MMNYQRLIEDELPGSTPKAQYESLMELKRNEMLFRVNINSLKPLIEGLHGSPKDATVGDLMIFIERMKEIVSRESL